MMQAMIFAAGLGTRLKPLTDTRPKALVEVGGQTLLQRTIERLKDAGARRIVVNVHHFARQIVDYLEANRHFGVVRSCLTLAADSNRRSLFSPLEKTSSSIT